MPEPAAQPAANSSAPQLPGGGGKKLAPMNWQILLQHNDVLLAVGMVLIVAMMMIPLPSMALDILLTVNIALAVVIMLVTLYTNEPLEYSTFPTILLVATLFRLGLNVSSTRLVLSSGQAGSVIESFGNFVIGGNYVVGLLIFIILVIINFIVITNGAGRVSEVAARFTLDAMPGKQLSIDADLNAGLINEEQAKNRRSQIQREADFYGTMDGASKFVKGDAIAGIIITVINIVGGLIIGVLQMGMPIMDAAGTFTVLTVGDGLVSQIPALLISTATGILVTRVSADGETSLGDDIGGQMFANVKVLSIVSALLVGMAFIPGLPTVPFLAIGVLAGLGGYFVYEGNKTKATEEAEQAQQQAEEDANAVPTRDTVMDLLPVESLELEMGYRLVPLIEAEQGGDLLERIAQIRKQVATEFGFVLPSIRVRDNLQLPPNHYTLKLRGSVIASGDVQPEMWLAMVGDPDLAEPLEGAIETKEPAFGLDAYWVPANVKEDAETNGYTVVSCSAVMSTHITEIMKRYAAEILTHADVQDLLDHLKETHEPLVTGLIPDDLSVAEVHRVLQNLLREQVSIRDLASILECLSYHARVKKDLIYLTEQCRATLSRAICRQHATLDNGHLPVITLAPDIEERMAQGLMEDSSLVLSPSLTQQLIQSISQQVQQIMTTQGCQPVVLCSAQLRLGLRKLLERALPQVGILSYNEIASGVKVQTLANVRAEAPEGSAGTPAMAS